MTWLDALVLLLLAVCVLFEARQEAGRGLLDAVGTIAAVHLAQLYATPLTQLLGLPPMPGADASPVAHGLVFLLAWPVLLLFSRWLHRQTRWSMDHFDLPFGVVFGLLVAILAGHTLLDVGARIAVMEHGRLPAIYENSALADELRSFRSYHYVIDTFEAAQQGRN